MSLRPNSIDGRKMYEYDEIYSVKPTQLIQNPDKVKQTSREIRKNLKQQGLYTINYLASGKDFNGKDLALGENTFIESGICDSDLSDDSCKNKTKYTYVRNIPTGTIPPFNLSFFNVTGCNLDGLTEGRGLIPGLVEDIYDVNPIEITYGSLGSGNLGSDVCKNMTLPVGIRIFDKDKENVTWKWDKKCTAGHHTMTETTDHALNEKIRQKNLHIKNARMPGPLQLRENFSNSENMKSLTYLKISMLIFLSSIIIIKFTKP